MAEGGEPWREDTSERLSRRWVGGRVDVLVLVSEAGAVFVVVSVFVSVPFVSESALIDDDDDDIGDGGDD
jgi:hypothetical protein